MPTLDPATILASYRAVCERTEHGGSAEDFATVAAWIPALVDALAARDRAIRGMRHRPLYCENDEDEIALEWRNGEKRISVYAPLESLTWIASWGAHPDTEMEDGDGSPAELLRWLWGDFATPQETADAPA